MTALIQPRHDLSPIEIEKRHGITDRKEQFDTANKVVASITSSVKAK